MNDSNRTPERTFWQRLRPFVRRDLKSRLISAAIAALVIAGLSWFGISAFTRLDSVEAQQLRTELGIEDRAAVCSTRPNMPECTYDDRVQAANDTQWVRDQRIRAGILDDLDLRIEATQDRLSEAQALLARQQFDFSNGEPAGGDEQLAALLVLPDLSPLRFEMVWSGDTTFTSLLDASTWDIYRELEVSEVQTSLSAAIVEIQRQLGDHAITVDRQRERDGFTAGGAVLDRHTTLIDLDIHADRYELSSEARQWVEQGRSADLSRSAFNLADAYPAEFATALLPGSALWEGGWDSPSSTPRHVPTVRYASPVEDHTRYELVGALFLAFASFIFVVVGPVVTATATAREREAGTLPVLRMTGMGAGDLAVAMMVGPNVFALVLGGSLLATGALLLTITGHFGALLVPVAMLGLLTVATHLTAIGLGDALGQRVNAMVVGGLLGAGVMMPGLLGASLAGFDIASTGLLLGPLPPLWATIAHFSGIHGVGIDPASLDDLATTMLAYSVAVQAVLGLVCLASWRRRVERGWAPLFKPAEGVTLALASIGCSALTLLDISNHHHAQDFDALNLLTFLSSAFLLPVLAWLLVASLRRPARARAVADHIEARRAFLRFQGFIAISVALVGMTYYLVMGEAGLASDDSELMWATLAQLLLAAETGVATLLWASRRREQKLRIAFLGGAAVLMQLVSVLGTYGLEVEHVARHNAAALPLLLNADVSGYWMAFLVLCWSTGLALVFTALLRRRDAEAATARDTDDDDEPFDDDDDEEFEDDPGMPGRRLLH